MTTTTSQLHVVKNAIVDGLAMRAGLAGVQVASAYLGKDTKAESIQIGVGDELNQSWSQIGNRERQEDMIIRGIVWVMKPGADEAVIRTTRARAVALMAEIEDFLRVDPSIGGLVKVSEIVPKSCTEHANPDGRMCQVDFDVHTMNRLRS